MPASKTAATPLRRTRSRSARTSPRSPLSPTAPNDPDYAHTPQAKAMRLQPPDLMQVQEQPQQGAAAVCLQRAVRRMLLRTAGRRKARTSARTATLVATASSLDRAAAPARRREGVRAPPARPQLRRAALCGPVLLRIVDAYEAYVALGDG